MQITIKKSIMEKHYKKELKKKIRKQYKKKLNWRPFLLLALFLLFAQTIIANVYKEELGGNEGIKVYTLFQWSEKNL